MAGQGLKLFGSGRTPSVAPTETRAEIVIAGRALSYTLKHSSRRSFALQLDPRGIRVAAPLGARREEVERFVQGHAGWLIDKLGQQAQRQARQLFEPVDGALFPVFGQSCRLRLIDHSRGVKWGRAEDGLEELCIGRRADPDRMLVAALKKRSLVWFEGRVAEYCHRLGLVPPPVGITSARTRWGSCSARSGIRLHWRLLHLPAALGDYVVAHEVAHLLEMNHSPRFWSVVERLYPDWRSARVALRKAGAELPMIGVARGREPVDDIRED